MGQYLYKIQPVRPAMLTEGPNPEEQQATSDHFNYLKGLMAEGVVIMAGRTQNSDYSSFGIVIFNAEDDDHAAEIIHNDPAVQARVMRAEWFPYAIALMEPNNIESQT